jgi:hypothetical protein
MGSLPVPRVLAERLGDGATQGLVTWLASTRADWTGEAVTIAAVRFERYVGNEVSALRRDLTRELSAARQDFTRELSGVRQDFTRELSAVRQDFTRGLASVRVELLRWSFLFWACQVAAMAGLLAFMLKR